MLLKQYLTFGDAVREFLRSTSTHGLRRVGWSTNPAAKIIWSFLFLLALAGYVTVLVLLLKEYYTYPTKILITKDVSHQMFPGVTLCNLNPTRTSVVWSGRPLDGMEKFVRDARWNMSLTEGERDPYLKEASYFVYQMSRMTYSERKAIGHTLRGLIKHCSFRGRECDLDSDFVPSWNDAYGNCFTYSGGKLKDNGKIKVSNESGPLNGLSVIAFTEPRELMNTLTEGEGIRLLVHPSTDMPLPDLTGISIPSRFETIINVEIEEHKHLGHPYGECSNDESNKFGYSYSSGACLKMCRQEKILSRCDCVDPMQPLAGENEPHCRINQIHAPDYICMKDTIKLLDEGSLRCTCPPPCKEMKYKTDFSLSQWPNSNHKNFLKYMMKPTDTNAFDDKDFDGMVAAKVFFKEIGRTVFTEETTFTLTDFLSHMGGMSAIFIGVSILTLVEFLELLFTLVTIPCVNYRPWPEDMKSSTPNPGVESDEPPTARDTLPPASMPDAEINDQPLPDGLGGPKMIRSSH